MLPTTTTSASTGAVFSKTLPASSIILPRVKATSSVASMRTFSRISSWIHRLLSISGSSTLPGVWIVSDVISIKE